MKKNKLYKVIALLILSISIIGCETGKVDNGQNDNTSDPYKKIKFEPISSLDDLKGTWELNGKFISYPITIDGIDYLQVKYPTTSDDSLWTTYAANHKIKLIDLWEKRFAAISDIYKKDSPIADENGTQAGYKVRKLVIYGDYSGSFESNYYYLIPETIVQKNLQFFSKSADNKYLKESGSFRFYSSKFNTISVNNDVFSNILNGDKK